MPNQIDFQKVALETLRIEEQALQILATQIDERFSQACEIILQCKGRLVITGMGKSGILAVRWRQLLHLRVRLHSSCTRARQGMVILGCWYRVTY